MKNSDKILLGLSGAILVALGIYCICSPGATILSAAIIIGILTLASGISTIFYWGKVRKFFPAGNVLLTGVLEIILGIIFLNNSIVVAFCLPVIFSCWLLIEGIILAIRSFDFKQVGFSYWWIIFILGLAATVLGFFALRDVEDVASPALSGFIGFGIIILGCIELIALFGINKFEKGVKNLIDEQ